MSRKSAVQQISGSRPFPIDEDRKNRCISFLRSIGMSQSELAINVGVSAALISAVISGRQPSPSLEKRIAMFLGVPETQLFPVRAAGEIARMRETERTDAAKKAALRQARLAARAKAGGTA